jgi:hypothetical protein
MQTVPPPASNTHFAVEFYANNKCAVTWEIKQFSKLQLMEYSQHFKAANCEW